MDTYRDICESNKHLYAQLEQYSWEISYCLVKGLADDLEVLTNQKEGIRELININLEKLDAYWESVGEQYIPERKMGTYFLASKKEQLIIDTYTDNPNQSMKTIGSIISASKFSVSRVITKYLAAKYGKEELNVK